MTDIDALIGELESAGNEWIALRNERAADLCYRAAVALAEQSQQREAAEQIAKVNYGLYKSAESDLSAAEVALATARTDAWTEGFVAGRRADHNSDWWPANPYRAAATTGGESHE